MKAPLRRTLAAALALTMLAGLCPAETSAAPAETGQSVFSTTEDTYIKQDSAGTNYGEAHELTLRKSTSSNENRILLKFDISSFSGQVDSATLRLKTTAASTNAGTVREEFVRVLVSEIADTWTEDEATWTASSVLAATPVAQGDISARAGETSDVDLTGYVRQAVTEGKKELSLLLTSKQSYATFASSETGEGPALHINLYGPEDESGHELWLRYHGDQVPQSMLGAYQGQVSALVTDQDITTPGPLKSAVDELKLGAKGLLDNDLMVTDSVSAAGAVVLGTKNSTMISGLGLDLTGLGEEGYLLKRMAVNGHQTTVVAANCDIGVLYGVFRLLSLMQTGKSLENLDFVDKPANDYRMLNHWDNPNLSIERGYAGLSLWDWSTLPEDTAITDPIYREYARANASIGINGIVLNNVNAKPEMISQPYLKKIARLADLMGEYGIKLYISLNFGSPKTLDGGDFTWDELQPWWTAKFTEIHNIVPELGGFLIKADSEGQPGPNGYGKGHVDGANMLGDALKASAFGENGLIIWRAFVYGDKDSDRATQAYNAFKPLDGQFRDNVVIQIKNGPLDFQTRETIHPLFGAMPNTNIALELQITQEYTGQDLHNCYLVPQWKEILDFDTYANGAGSTVAKIIGGEGISMVAGVANTAGLENWTGLQLAQANWYGFGRLAWDPAARESDITADWTAMTFGNDPAVVETVGDILSDSWRLYESYTSPLGLHFVVDGQHLKPNPSGRESYHRADDVGIGFPRASTKDKTDMTIASNNFFPENRDRYANLATCPEELLLWFHHVPWTHTLKNGDRLIDRLYRSYAGGVNGVQQVIDQWETLEGKIDDRRFEEILTAFQKQKEEAALWRDTWIPYLEGKSGIPMDIPHLPGKFSAVDYAPEGATVEDGALVLGAGESVSYWAGIEWGEFLPTLYGTGTGNAQVEIAVGNAVAGTISLGAGEQAWSAEKPIKLSSSGSTDMLTLTVKQGEARLTEVEFTPVADSAIQNWALASRGSTVVASATAAGCNAAAVIDGRRAYTGAEKDRWKTKGENVTIDITLPQPISLKWVYLFNQQPDLSGYPEPDREQTTSLYAAPLTVSYWDMEAEAWVSMGGVPDGENHVWAAVAAPEGVVTDQVRVTVEKVRDGWMRLIEVEVWGAAPSGSEIHALTAEGDAGFVQVGETAVTGKALTAQTGESVTVQTKGNPRAFQGWELVDGPEGFTLSEAAAKEQTLTFSMPAGAVKLRAKYDQGKNWALPSNGGTVTAELVEGEKTEGPPSALIDGYRCYSTVPKNNYNATRRWRAKGTGRIELTLAKPVEIYTVGIFSQQNDGGGYYAPDREETTEWSIPGAAVSYWDEGAQDWKPLGALSSDSDKVWDEVFAPAGIVSDKLRVEVAPHADAWVRVIEIEVWGTEPTEPEVYQVSVSETVNGTVTVDPTEAAEGTEVTIAVTPDAGCHLKEGSLKVYKTGDSTTTVDVTENKFVMPGHDVTVTAEFEPDPVITGVSVTPAEATVQKGTSQQFISVVTGENDYDDTVLWSVAPAEPEESAAPVGVESAEVQREEDLAEGHSEELSETDVSEQDMPAAESINESPIGTCADINFGVPVDAKTDEGSSVGDATASEPADGEPTVASLTETTPAGLTAGTQIDENGLLTVDANEIAATLIVTATAKGDETKFAEAIVTVSDEAVRRQALTVVSGTGSGNYAAGTELTVTADKPAAGKRFKDWTAIGVTLTDPTANPLTITMPDQAVTLTATYEDIPLDITALETAITAAEAAKNGISVRDEAPSSVPSGTRFVSTAVMTALNEAIETAKATKDTAENQEAVNDAAEVLNGAVATFRVAIQTGTYVRPSDSGSSGSSGTNTETEKNPDGSVTTIVTKPNGTVTETTKRPDGTTEVRETKKDGTITETVTKKDRSKSETVINPDGSLTQKVTTAEGVKTETKRDAQGNTTVNATIPVQAAEDGETVTLPIPAVDASKDNTVTVTAPKGTEVQVEVPVKDAAPGIVAVIVNEDGTETIVKTSVPTENGLALTVEGGFTVKIVDNSKDFADISAEHWAAEAVAFVTSRELFNGTGEDTFDPAATTSRAMLFTVLARLDGVDTEGGATWYDKAMTWSVEVGVSDGTMPETDITREQLITMLYRYAGQPSIEGEAQTYTDSAQVSAWAAEAMDWAVKTGILTGKDGDHLDPSGTATRAEVAIILQRFITARVG